MSGYWAIPEKKRTPRVEDVRKFRGGMLFSYVEFPIGFPLNKGIPKGFPSK